MYIYIDKLLKLIMAGAPITRDEEWTVNPFSAFLSWRIGLSCLLPLSDFYSCDFSSAICEPWSRRRSAMKKLLLDSFPNRWTSKHYIMRCVCLQLETSREGIMGYCESKYFRQTTRRVQWIRNTPVQLSTKSAQPAHRACLQLFFI